MPSAFSGPGFQTTARGSGKRGEREKECEGRCRWIGCKQAKEWAAAIPTLSLTLRESLGLDLNPTSILALPIREGDFARSAEIDAVRLALDVD